MTPGYLASIAPILKSEILDPGFLVNGDAPAPYGLPGVAVVLRILEHRGAIAPDNGWAPCDQPSWAAYIPRRDVEYLSLSDGALVRSPVVVHHGPIRRDRFCAARFRTPFFALEHIRAVINHVSVRMPPSDLGFLIQPRITEGARVRMSSRLRRHLAKINLNTSVPFSECEGVVQPASGSGLQALPDVIVRWEPRGETGAYDPAELEVV